MLDYLRSDDLLLDSGTLKEDVVSCGAAIAADNTTH